MVQQQGLRQGVITLPLVWTVQVLSPTLNICGACRVLNRHAAYIFFLNSDPTAIQFLSKPGSMPADPGTHCHEIVHASAAAAAAVRCAAVLMLLSSSHCVFAITRCDPISYRSPVNISHCPASNNGHASSTG